MRTRLIVAFIVVALLAALASQWVVNLVLPAFPSLDVLVNPPKWALHLVYEQSHPGRRHASPGKVLAHYRILPGRRPVPAGGHHRPAFAKS